MPIGEPVQLHFLEDDGSRIRIVPLKFAYLASVDPIVVSIFRSVSLNQKTAKLVVFGRLASCQSENVKPN
jgi:hypothetical protein